VVAGCTPLVVSFEDLSSLNTDFWLWDFPGGTPDQSGDPNPTITYDTPGTYDVTLTVINEVGSNTITMVDYIRVDPLPTPGFTFVVNGNTVDFTNTSTDADSYLWDFGDGNSSVLVDPSHTYDVGGTYFVELKAFNECGEQTITQEVEINVVLVAEISADILTGCAPLTVQFTDASSTGVDAWSWSFPGGTPNSSTEQNPSIVYNTAGTYDVTLEVTNATGSSTVTESNYIVVNDLPVAGFTNTTNGTTVDFTNTSTNADSYSWDFGDGNSSTLENPMHIYEVEGDYEVTLTVSNDCGTEMITETVTAIVVPIAGFSANITNGCAPLTVEFSNTSSGGTADAFSWSFPGGTPSTSTLENPIVTYQNAGQYTVELEVSNAAGNNTTTQTDYIVVNTLPSANFTGLTTGTIVTFTNTSSGATAFSWDFGDGTGSDDTNPSHDFNTDGFYTVTLTAENDCGSVTYSETFEIVTEPLAGFSSDVTTGCADLTVNFMDMSSDNTDSWLWTFEGGNPATSSRQPMLVDQLVSVKVSRLFLFRQLLFKQI